MTKALIIRNVEINGHTNLDVRIAGGHLAEIGHGLKGGGSEIDAFGGALIPGLADHHIHILSLSAQQDSLDLSDTIGHRALFDRLSAYAARKPVGAWIRATGYHERIAGELRNSDLDKLAPDHKLRIQHQTGSLWILNSAALDALGVDDYPDCVEKDRLGRPTGRIRRGDSWLRERIGVRPPPIALIGAQLAAYGITHLTDASVTNDQRAADILASAVRSGELRQHLSLMSGGPLGEPTDGAFRVGPVKILLDDDRLPDVSDFAKRIDEARQWDRSVAVHCVTAAELAITLAAYDLAGVRLGDRIEHGGLIPEGAIPLICGMGLTVVTQPSFVFERGERYLADVEPHDLPDLYRCASLIRAGIAVAASSDAPYASPNPWRGIAAAVERCSRQGHPVGVSERVSPAMALSLYVGDPNHPGLPARRVKPGVVADLCLLKLPLRDALNAPDAKHVALTLLAGAVTYDATATPSPGRFQ